MGTILKQRLADDGVIAEVLLTKEEVKDLEGEMENITVFTEDRADTETRISLRGRNQATQYFLIPKTLRNGLNTMGSVSCQRLQRRGKDIYVYVVENDTERESYLPEEAAT